jgi:hypothetical protein
VSCRLPLFAGLLRKHRNRMSNGDRQGSQEAREFLKGLIAVGRRYDVFALEHPSTVAVRISEMNAPGADAGAWDLFWVPAPLRPRIARTASTIVLKYCRSAAEADKAALMDTLMPVAIVTACLVADIYGLRLDIPAPATATRMDPWLRLLRTALDSEETGGPEASMFEDLLPPLADCLPLPVRGRLAHFADLLRQEGRAQMTVNYVIVLVGAVATDAFDSLRSLV